MTSQILIVDRAGPFSLFLARSLAQVGHVIRHVSSFPEGAEMAGAWRPDLLILGLHLDDGSGVQFLRALQAQQDDLPPVLFITVDASQVRMLDGLGLRIFDFLQQPISVEGVRRRVDLALLSREPFRRSLEVQDVPLLRGCSPAYERVLRQLTRLAPLRAGTLIRGEPGSGRLAAARLLHEYGPQAAGPFVTVDCRASAPEALEQVLFAPGADGDDEGAIMRARGGTLFLKEVDHLSRGLQQRLLPALREQGSQVRLLASAASPLADGVQRGSFEEALYRELATTEVGIPPLRRRMEELPSLVSHFILLASRERGEPPVGVTEEVMALFRLYHWPANLRELREAIRWAVAHCGGQALARHHLPPTLQAFAPLQTPISCYAGNVEVLDDLEAAILRHERELIERALWQARGNPEKAARALKINRKTLRDTMSRFHIDLFFLLGGEN